MGSSSSKDVYISTHNQGVGESDSQPYDRPLRNPPQIRRNVTVPPHLWVSDLFRSNDSVRHCHNPTYRPRSVHEDGTAEQLLAALGRKLQQVRIEVDTVTTAFQTATTYVGQLEKERNDYKILAYRSEMKYSRLKKCFRGTNSTSSQAAHSEPSAPCPSPPSPLQDHGNRSSSAGPSRRNSTLKNRRQSWPFGNRRRSWSTDPSTPPEEEESTSFAVTSIAPALPAETLYRRDGHYDKQYIRDGSGSPRPTPPPCRQDEIGIHHVDIMYDPSVPGWLSCRYCRRGGDSTDFRSPADWEELREHYTIKHPEICEKIAQLTPEELEKLRGLGYVPK